MAIDTSVPRTRRALLAGGLGGLVAVAASALGRPLPTRAANDSPVILGQDNTETQTTAIVISSTEDALVARNAAETVGVALCAGDTGVSTTSDRPNGMGVWGRSTGNGTGIYGWSQLIGTEFGFEPPAKTGVHGRAIQDASSRGVTGETTAGRGVNGVATTGAAGYFATTDPRKGYALRAVGRVKLDKCAGVTTIVAGTKSKTVTPGIDVVATAAVVATLQGSPGGTTTVQRVSLSPTADTFTIYLTANTTADVKVAWIILG
jgi:hypothetical protein